MKIRELREGFLDDLAAAMRDADSFSGFLKGLGGGSAKLDQISRKIFTDAERVLVSGQTNLRQPNITDADIPMDRLIVAAFNAAAEFSKTSKNPVTRGDLLAHFKKHQVEILKGMNMQATGANLARDGAEEVNKLLARRPSAAIPNAGLKGNLEAISLLAALSLLDLEFRRATDQDSEGGGKAAERFEFSPEQLKFFNEVGDQILETLFTPGAQLHRYLLINQDFRDNMKKFVEQMHSQIQRDFANLSTEQLKARKNRYDQVVSPMELRAAMIGHIDPNDPRLPANYDQVVQEIVTNYKKSFDSLISTWISLARVERAKTGSPLSQEAFSVLTSWADRAIRLLDGLKFTSAKPKQPQQAGQKIPQAGRSSQNSEDEAHQFASDEAEKLKAGPGETPDQLAIRKGREYQKAFADYFERNPPQ